MDSFAAPPALLPCLEAAVPLHAMELARLPWHLVEQLARAAGQVIAEKGDVLQFGSKKKGAAADAFNALARGLAALSFVPGGVDFLGAHFEHAHPGADGGRTRYGSQPLRPRSPR